MIKSSRRNPNPPEVRIPVVLFRSVWLRMNTSRSLRRPHDGLRCNPVVNGKVYVLGECAILG